MDVHMKTFRPYVLLPVLIILGRSVGVIVDGVREAGYHEVVWSPVLASGVYFCRFEAHPLDGAPAPAVRTLKLVLSK